MKELGMVKGERQAQWMVYRLAEPENRLLRDNLRCLQDVVGEHLCFREDLAKREGIMVRLQAEGSGCAEALLAGENPFSITN